MWPLASLLPLEAAEGQSALAATVTAGLRNGGRSMIVWRRDGSSPRSSRCVSLEDAHAGALVPPSKQVVVVEVVVELIYLGAVLKALRPWDHLVVGVPEVLAAIPKPTDKP